jgi:hypothetical protein
MLVLGMMRVAAVASIEEIAAALRLRDSEAEKLCARVSDRR